MYKIYGAKAPFPFLKGLIRENRPIWFLEETGLPYERISVDPAKKENLGPEYSKLNPFNKIPTMVDGDFVLKQSAAIVQYLATSTGKLYPKSIQEQALHQEWILFAMTDIEPHSMPIGALLNFTDESEKIHAQWMVTRAEKILARALNYLETQLNEKTFLMGSEFYAADIILGCCLWPVRKHELIQSRPNITRLLESYYSRPAFKKAFELNGT